MKNDYPIIETKRLLLRKWKSQDFAPFYKINSHPKVCQYLPKILTESESNEFANKIIQKFQNQGFGLFALEINDSGKFIGYTGLNIPNFDAPKMPSGGPGILSNSVSLL